MIERDFVAQKSKEFYIKKYIENKLNKVGISLIKLKKIPLGEKIIIHTSRPSLIVGSKGANIKDLTKTLKKDFKLENPQIEIVEVKDIFLDANIVAEKIADSLERFGSARFKSVGHKTMENIMKSGALGVEIIISGKIPGARAKSWRFYQGYLKKCGEIACSGVRKAQKFALLKSGIIGIKVAIMPDIKLPDNIDILEEPEQIIEEIKEVKEVIEEKKTKKKGTKKKTTSKKKKVETEKVKEDKKEIIIEAGKTEVSEENKVEEVKEAEETKEEVKEEQPEITEEVKETEEETKEQQ